jgi:precorrin-2 methylase
LVRLVLVPREIHSTAKKIIADYVAELEDSKKLAEDSVQQFRSQIERNQFKDVYDRSNEILKKYVSLFQMISLCKDLKKWDL